MGYIQSKAQAGRRCSRFVLLFYLIPCIRIAIRLSRQDEEGTLCIRRPVPVITQLLYCAVFCVLHVVAFCTICTHITEFGICVHQLQNLQRFCLVLGVCGDRVHRALNGLGCVQRSEYLSQVILLNTRVECPCGCCCRPALCRTEDGTFTAVCYNVSIGIDDAVLIPFVQPV